MKKLVALLLALAVLVGGWWYASPLMALDGLRDAAVAGDAAELEERVDFPKLRDSVRTQLRTALTQAAQGQGDDSFGAIGAGIGLMVVDGLVDNLVTPEWIARTVVEGQKIERQTKAAREALPVREAGGADMSGSPEPKEAGTEPAPAEPSFDIERMGFSSFRVTTESAEGETGPTLLFERDGLGWDLVGVEMEPSKLVPGGR